MKKIITHAEKKSFHNVYVNGVSWNLDKGIVSMDIDFIDKWVLRDGVYEYMIAPASLNFYNCGDISIDLQWGKFQARECKIDSLTVIDNKEHNNKEFILIEIIFFEPDSEWKIWTEKCELILKSKPVLSTNGRRKVLD